MLICTEKGIISDNIEDISENWKIGRKSVVYEVLSVTIKDPYISTDSGTNTTSFGSDKCK